MPWYVKQHICPRRPQRVRSRPPERWFRVSVPRAIRGPRLTVWSKGLVTDLRGRPLLGVTGSGKTFTIASVIEPTQRPAIILAPNKTLAAQLYGEMREFFPNNAVEYFVSYYDYYQPEAYVPSSDTYIEKDASINQHIEQMRLSATKALLERPDAIIVATVSSIYGLGDPEAYFSMVLHLVAAIESTSARFCDGSPNCSTNAMSWICRRARIASGAMLLTCFPAESERDAVRIELFDDEIESLSYFDPLDGRGIGAGTAADDLPQDALRDT